MRHRAARPLDRWRLSTLPAPVRSAMLVGGGLVVLGAALGAGLVNGSPDPGDAPAPVSAGSGDHGVAELPAAQHTEPAPALTPRPRTHTRAAAGPGTVRPASAATTAAPAAASVPANQPPAAAVTRPGHGHGLAKGHHKH